MEVNAGEQYRRFKQQAIEIKRLLNISASKRWLGALVQSAA